MDFKEIKEIDAKRYMKTFSRQNICFTHGKGSKLYDTAGNEYIDLGGGIAVNCLGHDDPELTEAICAQAHKLIHVSNLYYNEPRIYWTARSSTVCFCATAARKQTKAR